MTITLHDYQNAALDSLRDYFCKVRKSDDADMAFYGVAKRTYYPAPEMAAVPYVCIKVPTGGGKTLIAANALGVTREYTQAESATFLWLAPTGAIVEQTLKHLKNPRSPYHQAVKGKFGDISVMSITEALHASPPDISGGAWIVVGTFQSSRRKSTGELKIYSESGDLMPHFQGETDEKTLANLLKKRRPVVISDEAHNAGTDLSFKTLSRFDPACIIEFTATPQMTHNPAKGIFASNVLHQTSAFELKKAEMVKLPINLYTDSNLPNIIRAAVNKRGELADIADENEKETGEYIRPIVLYQAQSENQNTPPKELKRMLVKDFKIPERHIAIATGQVRELPKNILSRDCEVRHIITKQALAEGWDCPFAYVLCSVANIGSPKSVEQILGRVLRMPQAKRKSREELNWSYAFAVSPNFYEAAALLKTVLVDRAGFERIAADKSVRDARSSDTLPGMDKESPAPESANEGKSLTVPMLAIRVGKQLQIVDEDHFLEAEWNLADCDAALNESALLEKSATAGKVDIGESRTIEMRQFSANLNRQMMRLYSDANWERSHLISWLDQKFPHPDIPQHQSVAFIGRALSNLIDEKKLTMAQLAGVRFRLAGALADRIAEHRREQKMRGYQAVIIKNKSRLLVEFDASVCLNLTVDKYAPDPSKCDKRNFEKHLFSIVGQLDNDEEAQCACLLDQLPQVEVWLRNLSKRPDTSFWLPTPDGRFYPDFVARLHDGRIFVVEYKGAHLWDGEKDKRDIGEVWAKCSKGKCIFVMPKGPDWAEIKNAIAPKKKSARKAN